MFTIVKHVLYPGHYKLKLDLSIYSEITTEISINSSYNILPARLLGLPFDKFLLYIQQEFDAELHGRVGRYVTYSFKNKEKAEVLAKELSDRWDYLLSVK